MKNWHTHLRGIACESGKIEKRCRGNWEEIESNLMIVLKRVKIIRSGLSSNSCRSWAREWMKKKKIIIKKRFLCCDYEEVIGKVIWWNSHVWMPWWWSADIVSSSWDHKRGRDEHFASGWASVNSCQYEKKRDNWFFVFNSSSSDPSKASSASTQKGNKIEKKAIKKRSLKNSSIPIVLWTWPSPSSKLAIAIHLLWLFFSPSKSLSRLEDFFTCFVSNKYMYIKTEDSFHVEL